MSLVQAVPMTEDLIPNGNPSDQGLFGEEIWREPLGKFASATGLTIALYDKSLVRRSCITTSSPIAERLTLAGFWDDDGLGTKTDREAAARCFESGEITASVVVSMFSHIAVPLTIDSETLAVFVMGWLPDRFADPVNCDNFAKRIGVEPMDIWLRMRMQQPMARDKLTTHARMLETFSVPLMRQLLVQLDDRRRACRSKIISDAALGFAHATSEKQICSAAFLAFRSLARVTSSTIFIQTLKDETEEEVTYEHHWPDERAQIGQSSVRSHLTIAIPSATGRRPLGSIDLTIANPGLADETLDDLQAVASQLGIALQKVHLIHALEGERSALKGANVQLRHLHQMKDEFLATVSHELRTPLNAIMGWAQILKEEGPAIAEFPRAIDTIERNAKNQSHLIEDLLDVSRIISGKMSLRRESVEATSLLRQTLETVFPMTEARRQKVHLQISSAPIHLKGDGTRISQIFWNLLSNASKFTPEGGDISVILENAGHYFRLEVSDTGKGISPEFLPHLFDRFSQADSSYTRRHGGLGLGLAIVRHLVELHGGTVTASSRGDGQGATFSVFLPQNTTDQELDSAQSLTKFERSAGASSALKLKDVKILLVDDEPDALRLTRFVLEKNGALIQLADNTEEGFQKFREWRPDVLVSDISMPGESGYDLIRRIRALPTAEGARTPAVALTALAGAEQRDLALSAGFQLHIAKPLEPNPLVDALSALARPVGLKVTGE